MTLSDKLATDVMVSTLVNASQKVRGLVFVPLLTRFLGVAAYGAFVQVRVVTVLLAKVSQLGLQKALIRYSQENDDVEQSQLYAKLTVVAVCNAMVVGAITFGAAAWIAAVFLDAPQYASAFHVGAILVPTYSAREMAQNYYRAEMDVKRFSLYEGAKTYLNVGAVSAVVLFTGVGVTGVVAVVVATELLFAVVLQAVVLRTTGLSWPAPEGLPEILEYSVPIMVGNVSGVFQDRADRLLLGFFVGAGAVGVYSVSYTVARVLRLYVLPLRVTFFPEFSRLWTEGDRETCKGVLANGARYMVALAVPSIVGLYLVAEPLVGLLSTSRASASATVLLPVLAAGLAVLGLETLYRQLFLADERTLTVSGLRVAASVANVGLNVVLIPRMGVVGAAVATLATYLGTFVALFALARRTYGVEFVSAFTTKAALSAGGMFGVVTLVGVDGLVPLLLICPPVYFSLLVLTRAVEVQEIRSLLGAAMTIPRR